MLLLVSGIRKMNIQGREQRIERDVSFPRAYYIGDVLFDHMHGSELVS